MTGMADPTTLAALAVGLMTGVGFLLVAVGAEGSGSRRYTRRLDQMKSRRLETSAAASNAADTRSLSRTTRTRPARSIRACRT